jgi:hypothetical protein
MIANAESMAARMARLTADSPACNFGGALFASPRYGGRTGRVDPAEHGIRGAVLLEMKRAEPGRCSRAVYLYADGSALQFRWRPAAGARVEAFAPRAALFLARCRDGRTLYYRDPLGDPIAYASAGTGPRLNAPRVMLDCAQWPAVWIAPRADWTPPAPPSGWVRP